MDVKSSVTDKLLIQEYVLEKLGTLQNRERKVPWIIRQSMY